MQCILYRGRLPHPTPKLVKVKDQRRVRYTTKSRYAKHNLFLKAGVLCLQVVGHPTVCFLRQVSSVCRLRDILQSVYYGRCTLFTG